MTKPLIQIGNEVREMTELEYEQWQLDNTQIAADRAAAEAMQIQRNNALSKLAALGLTADEIAALVG